jgi:hypothetical protein
MLDAKLRRPSEPSQLATTAQGQAQPASSAVESHSAPRLPLIHEPGLALHAELPKEKNQHAAMSTTLAARRGWRR